MTSFTLLLMCMATVCEPGCDVMNVEVNLS